VVEHAWKEAEGCNVPCIASVDTGSVYRRGRGGGGTRLWGNKELSEVLESRLERA